MQLVDFTCLLKILIQQVTLDILIFFPSNDDRDWGCIVFEMEDVSIKE